MTMFYPTTLEDCRECPHLQFQDAENTGTALRETYLCKWLRARGVNFQIEVKRIGEAIQPEDAFRPHKKCPLKADLNDAGA